MTAITISRLAMRSSESTIEQGGDAVQPHLRSWTQQ
jgi:hypothetical protein